MSHVYDYYHHFNHQCLRKFLVYIMFNIYEILYIFIADEKYYNMIIVKVVTYSEHCM